MAQKVQHSAIRDPANIHECKQVASADTTDSGKVITPSDTEPGKGVLRQLRADELDWQGFQTPGTGWLLYADSDNTTADPFPILSGETKNFPVGENTTVQGRAPDGMPELYNGATQRVVGYSALDVYLVQISFLLQSSETGVIRAGFSNTPSAGPMEVPIPFRAASTGQRLTTSAVVPVFSDTVSSGISVTLTPDADVAVAYPEITITLLSRG